MRAHGHFCPKSRLGGEEKCATPASLSDPQVHAPLGLVPRLVPLFPKSYCTHVSPHTLLSNLVCDTDTSLKATSRASPPRPLNRHFPVGKHPCDRLVYGLLISSSSCAQLLDKRMSPLSKWRIRKSDGTVSLQHASKGSGQPLSDKVPGFRSMSSVNTECEHD